MTTPGQRPFSAYLRLWAIANLLRISIGLNAGTGLVGSTLDANFFSLATLPALVALAGLVPARWSGALPLVALVARAATNAAKGSMMSNSQMWATQMDAALVLSLLRRLGSAARHGSSWSSPLSAEDERAVVGGCARTVRWQLAIFYFASGFWKAARTSSWPSLPTHPALTPRTVPHHPRQTRPSSTPRTRAPASSWCRPTPLSAGRPASAPLHSSRLS